MTFILTIQFSFCCFFRHFEIVWTCKCTLDLRIFKRGMFGSYSAMRSNIIFFDMNFMARVYLCLLLGIAVNCTYVTSKKCLHIVRTRKKFHIVSISYVFKRKHSLSLKTCKHEHTSMYIHR